MAIKNGYILSGRRRNIYTRRAKIFSKVNLSMSKWKHEYAQRVRETRIPFAMEKSET